MATKRVAMIIKVALSTPLRRLFDYLPPRFGVQSLQPGMRVRVPFGKKTMAGVIVAIEATSAIPASKLKTMTDVIDVEPIFSNILFTLLLWAADYYQHSLGDVLHQAMPMLLRQGQQAELPVELFWELAQIDLDKIKRAPKQLAAFNLLQTLTQSHPLVSQHELQAFGIQTATLKMLSEKGLIRSVQQIKKSVPATTPIISVKLSHEQEVAVENIQSNFDQFNPMVLQGITGSGKTEVYLAVIRHIVEQGKQALVLIPEIGLTPQILQRFKERLSCSIVVIHSNLTDKERLLAYLQARSGAAQVVIGTRSAIFTDFDKLGLIVVDEAHDASFKQWEGFKYHATDLAVRRAQLTNIPIILGSATPSLNTLHNVEQGRFKKIILQHRIAGAQLPTFKIMDIRRQPLKEGIAVSVLNRMAQHLEHGNQVLVFINRRGYAPVLMCHECGWIDECSRCNASYTLHKSSAPHLSCHHCGKQKPIPKKCAECLSDQLLEVGLGTQRVEHLLSEEFPGKKIARIDRDTTRHKGSLEKNLHDIHQGVSHILIGTQMLAKGHHFPNVTLVVMLDVDGGLYSADYMASERMAQLLIQVAGRAGRAEKPGEVVIQTHQPEHPLLQTLVHDGYEKFATLALQQRAEMKLPPFRYFVLIRSESFAQYAGKMFLEEMKVLFQQENITLHILGPIQAPIEKRQGRYRWQLLLRAEKRSALHQLLKMTLPTIETLKSARSVRWSVDVDPIDML